MQAEALVDTLVHMVAELQANALVATFCPVEPKSLVKTVTDF